MRHTLLVFIALLFCFGQAAKAADSTQEIPLNPSTSGATGTSTPLHLYTQPASLPDNIDSFVTDINNYCLANETRSICFKRILVWPATGGTYLIRNKNLSCPQGYYVIAAMGNTALDVANPDQLIYYYDTFKFTQVTEAQYNYYSSLTHATCGMPNPVPSSPANAGSSCISMGCEKPLYKTINGYYAVKVRQGNTYLRDTYLSGANKCDAYTLSGCPAGTCGRRSWENYSYYYVTCSREGGFFAPDPAKTELPSFKYSPTIVICGKPSTVWKTPRGETR